MSFSVYDAQRMRKATGLRMTVEAVGDAEWGAITYTLPWANLLFPHRLRIFAPMMNGRCSAHTPSGCAMPLMERPRFCAIAPCWYDPDDSALLPFYWATGRTCLAVERAQGDPEKLFANISITPQTLLKIAKVYHGEMRAQENLSEKQIRSMVLG